MDQGAGDVKRRRDGGRVRETRISMSPSHEDSRVDDVYIEPDDTTASSRDAYDAEVVEPEDIERTRAHMSTTLEEIQERLNPDRMEDTAKEVAEDVKEAMLETVDHVIQEGRTTAEDFSEIARVATLETVDHTVEQLKALLPTVTEQARDLAQQTIDHAILEAKAAILELSGQARQAAREATIGKVERMVQTTGDKAGQLAQSTSEKAEQAAQSTTESTKKLSSTLMTTIKQNPGPAALTGLGLGWLVMSGKGGSAKSQSSASSKGGEKTVEEMTQDTGIAFETPFAGTRGDGAQATSESGGATDKAKDTAAEAAGQAKDAAGKVTGQAKETASTLTGQAKETAATVSEQVAQISARLRQTLREKPLAVGMVAVAIGSATGMAVPVSQKETQTFGGSRDKLMEKAQTGAQGLVEKVQKVATEAGSAVEKEAKYQGLTPEE